MGCRNLQSNRQGRQYPGHLWDFSVLRSRRGEAVNVPERRQMLALWCRKNALYFSASYAISAALVGVVTILLNPFFFFVLICLGGFWLDMSSATADESPENSTKIIGRTVTPEQRQLDMLGVSAAAIVVFV
ncbi:unnamed protein product [Peronospora destructor]|uniref:PRA1 family protein n=1 Tax=Peronospora destructor TaxID=86335 RepID=A0AAV0VL37_9STRA|nr:unnamed protein product [Peronospora destructor]